MTPCILSIRTISQQYPTITINRKTYYEHRLILTKRYNLDYDDYTWTAMHMCDNKRCINLDHLMVGTTSLNQLDSSLKKRHKESRKTHCKYGHEFSKENTFTTKKGKRECRTCRRIYDVKRNKLRPNRWTKYNNNRLR